ncbi:Ig domain-containing protein [Bacillus sp. NPDC077411]|uniref:Ig-like domain-containing protein n=1 Tax=Bacillus bruguierae TaxID=3127667 RepID=A0ABU8FFY6_9BACI|nr:MULTISPECIES: Ig-like domain-containing protein [unclassified Bacillus (in: firmicutes)]SFI89656.1 Ig-like domain (group 2) [Bacillus sp. 71mf]SFS66674.1 Ig-like domain (group 2) [Bacillus sp. 103mf]
MQSPFHSQKHLTSSPCAAIQTDLPHITIIPSIVPVIGIQLHKAKLKLKAGQRAELTATVLPSQASNQEIIWTCMNPHIVEIHTEKQKATVIGKQAGRAVIIVTTAEGKFRDLCIVHVQPYMTKPK